MNELKLKYFIVFTRAGRNSFKTLTLITLFISLNVIWSNVTTLDGNRTDKGPFESGTCNRGSRGFLIEFM